MKSMSKAPETERLKLKCDEPLSMFGLKFNVRRCTKEKSQRPRVLQEVQVLRSISHDLVRR
jgi:hypothetical protein